MANVDLGNAKRNKKDEFYTDYNVIQYEVNHYLEYDENVFKDKTILCPCDDPEWSNFTKFFAANFDFFGLKKLISTSYAPDSFKNKNHQFTFDDFLEGRTGKFDEKDPRGRKFILEHGANSTQRIDIDNLQWDYLDGDGDFRSDEVKKLRDEADIIITNPPFSQFRDFLAWIIEAHKKFLIIGNINCITYKEVFPLIMQNKIWLGPSIHSGDREFRVPDDYPLEASGTRVDEHGNKFLRIKGVRWFTNLEHGLRHQPLRLMTLADNLRFSKHKYVRENGYPKYDNYDAIEVPYVDAIPDDYYEVMGVPITFLDKYCPEQYEILGITELNSPFSNGIGKTDRPYINGNRMYSRILIMRKK